MVIRRRRRRARRLRRFRRPYRRTRRARRYRSRRSSGRRRRYYYGRRRRFFQRRGYKVASARWKVGGSLVRSYKFYVTKEQVNRSDGTLGTVITNNEWLPSLLSCIDSQTIPNNVDGWTGAGNMMSLYGLSAVQQRALGYDNYTLINMSFPGLFWLQYLGFFTNQEELIRSDLRKYSYYKPRSISVKFIPRLRPPPSKTTHLLPTQYTQPSTDTPVHRIPTLNLRAGGQISGTPTDTAWTATSGVAGTGLNPLEFYNSSNVDIIQERHQYVFDMTDFDKHEIWDHDGDSLVGYIIPAASQATVQNNSPLPSWWENGTMGHLKGNLNYQFLSSFRKAPYSRSYISNTKPTTFIARFPESVDCAEFKGNPGGGVPVYNTTDPPTIGHNNSMYDIQGAGPSPFSQTIPRSNGFIPAQLGSYNYQRTTPVQEAQNPLDASYNPIRISYPLFMPYENFNLFIPGIDLTSLLQRFRIQFSYKVWYSGKSFDFI